MRMRRYLIGATVALVAVGITVGVLIPAVQDLADVPEVQPIVRVFNGSMQVETLIVSDHEDGTYRAENSPRTPREAAIALGITDDTIITNLSQNDLLQGVYTVTDTGGNNALVLRLDMLWWVQETSVLPGEDGSITVRLLDENCWNEIRLTTLMLPQQVCSPVETDYVLTDGPGNWTVRLTLPDRVEGADTTVLEVPLTNNDPVEATMTIQTAVMDYWEGKYTDPSGRPLPPKSDGGRAQS